MYHYLSSAKMTARPLLWALALICLATACEDVIELDLQNAPQQLVVDAWISDLPGDQVIKLGLSQPYFEQAKAPGIVEARVVVERGDGEVFDFGHTTGGQYVWTPTAEEVIGQSGDVFQLIIEWQGETYTAETEMNRVPRIDSIGLEFRENEIFLEDGIYAQFYARDFPGAGDAYWIKAYKNGNYLNKSQELNLAYDAGFDAGTGIDGLIFIPPIREFINELDEDLIPQPYVAGEEILVEIHSLSLEAFDFMEIARDQINNGDNGIFALPLANTRTNIRSLGNGNDALGFFNVASVSSLSRVVD